MLPAPYRQLDGGSYAQRYSYRHRRADGSHLEPAGGGAAGRYWRSPAEQPAASVSVNPLELMLQAGDLPGQQIQDLMTVF
jgi:hypothetical protein